LHLAGEKRFESDLKHFTIIPSSEENYDEAHGTTTAQHGGENESIIFGSGYVAIGIIYVFKKESVTGSVFGKKNWNRIRKK